MNNSTNSSGLVDDAIAAMPDAEHPELEVLKRELAALKSQFEANQQATEAARAEEEAKAADKAKEEQLKIRYEHAKLANTHADAMIQSAERKGTFLLTLNSALFLLFANDLPGKLKVIYGFLGGNQIAVMVFGAAVAALLIAFGLLVVSYWALYSLFTPRIKENEFLSAWSSSYRPKELIFFDAICKLSKDEYHRRYETLTLTECWDDLSFQAYKQAQIAAIKYGCFHKAKRTSVWAWGIVMLAALVTRFFV